MKNLPRDEAAKLQQSLSLPADIEITEYLGTGARAHVFSARFGDDRVIAKIYRAEAARKYRQKYGVDIANFEFERNRKLYEIEAIKINIARPYQVYPASSEYTHCMIQEYVAGETLKDTILELGYLPEEVLEAGYRIIGEAEACGVHDLDISSKNVRIVKQEGRLIPRLYDFNLMPQHIHAPNPILALAIKLGLRNKSHRDYRNLKKWQRHGKNATPPNL